MLGYALYLVLFEAIIFYQAGCTFKFNNYPNVFSVFFLTFYCVSTLKEINPFVDHLLNVINMLAWF